MDLEHNHGPGLEPDTKLQPETETETQRDPGRDKKTANRAENEDPVQEEFNRRVDEAIMDTLKQDLPSATIQERQHINAIKGELIEQNDISNEQQDQLSTWTV